MGVTARAFLVLAASAVLREEISRSCFAASTFAALTANSCSTVRDAACGERDFFIDNLLVRIHRQREDLALLVRRVNLRHLSFLGGVLGSGIRVQGSGFRVQGFLGSNERELLIDNLLVVDERERISRSMFAASSFAASAFLEVSWAYHTRL